MVECLHSDWKSPTESENISEQIIILIRMLDRLPELKCIFTEANADCEEEKRIV